MAEHKRMFVYGTLRVGRSNHYIIEESQKRQGAVFVGVAHTCEKFPLCVASPYGIPFMLDKPGVGNFVEGEIWDVDSATLKVLDRLEGHPHHYCRRPVELRLGGTTVEAEAYLFPRFTQEMLSLPMLSAYTPAAAHTYVPPKSRPSDYWNDIQKLKAEES